MGELKSRFDDEIRKIKLAKGKHTQMFTRDEYYSLLNNVQVAKDKCAKKTPEEYQRLSRYVVKIGTAQKLIFTEKNKRELIIYYYLEKTFDIEWR